MHCIGLLQIITSKPLCSKNNLYVVCRVISRLLHHIPPTYHSTLGPSHMIFTTRKTVVTHEHNTLPTTLYIAA